MGDDLDDFLDEIEGELSRPHSSSKDESSGSTSRLKSSKTEKTKRLVPAS